MLAFWPEKWYSEGEERNKQLLPQHDSNGMAWQRHLRQAAHHVSISMALPSCLLAWFLVAGCQPCFHPPHSHLLGIATSSSPASCFLPPISLCNHVGLLAYLPPSLTLLPFTQKKQHFGMAWHGMRRQACARGMSSALSSLWTCELTGQLGLQLSSETVPSPLLGSSSHLSAYMSMSNLQLCLADI